LRIYIASPYITQQEINNIIYGKLKEAGYEAFLPESINIAAVTEEEIKDVAGICYSEIDKCDIILIVYPFGVSVACEAGYSIAQKMSGNKRKIILYLHANNEKIHKEAMFIPYVDFKTDTLDELLEYIKGNN
jgi:nucleoside 2-deoxyribosyltransferase